MKKILCLIDTLEIMRGGAERQMAGLARLLQDRGYSVDVATYYVSDTYSELPQHGLKLLKVKQNKWSKLMAVRYHIKCAGGYDWVIAYKDGPCIIGCLLKLLGGKFRLIVSERNTNQNVSKKDKVKFWLYRLADYIVPNSHSQAQFIKNNFPKVSNKIVTITNFTDTAHFHPIEALSNEKVNILTAARIASQKNVLNYLEAIRLLKLNGFADKIHFDWYGMVQPGEEVYGRSCLNKRIELGVEDMIEFHPATKEIAKHYQTCDIFCLPSIYEGFPNVVCEAMSCGKPVVCSRVCDNQHIVQEGINGLLFDPTDVNSIYLTLKQMVEMPKSKLLVWGMNSRSIAESLLSTETFVQKYIDLIESSI